MLFYFSNYLILYSAYYFLCLNFRKKNIFFKKYLIEFFQ